MTASDKASVPFGIIFVGDGLDDWVQYVRRADSCGFEALGVADSQSIYPDVYVRLTIAALQTNRLRIGSWVTNPVTRHPAVTANAIASVDEVSDGRAFLGIGTGDSSVDNLGLGSASRHELAEYVRTVSELLQRGNSTWNGATVRMGGGKRRVPIYMAATGPRALRLAGRMGDGVIIGAGLQPEVIEDSLDAVRAGVDESGRTMDDVDVWWLAVGNLGKDDAQALDEIKPSLATFANVAFKATHQQKRVPKDMVTALETLHAREDPMDHGVFGARHQAKFCDELGLTPYLAERFALSGSPTGFLEQVHRARAAGAEKLWLSVRSPDKVRFLDLWEHEVLPHLV